MSRRPAFPVSIARRPARSVSADRHGESRSIASCAAIARRERIAIHGDYDVDGVTSTVILRRALELLGADVVHFIPERLRDGYGLQPASLERLHADGVRLAISVDCGIRADEAARHAAALGLDLIITDHHEPDAALPPAFAIINPKRHDCSYPDKNLAGRRRRAEARAGAVPASGTHRMASGVRQDCGDRDAGRRCAADRVKTGSSRSSDSECCRPALTR